MVFESLVADLLNRFLGDFVENLDSSQLNLGIWGGDVKLENLEVKETALDDFDLPVKLKFGYLDSLVLKIPWKNLYTEPVIATIDGLYLIAVPNKGVVYNEEKAKKNAADIKQKMLARLEEARKNRRKPADPQADTFAEKMVTQIIKNLQISIANIHVRYEDKYTNRHRPFVAGVTLEKLDFRTTDENWIPTIHKEAVKIIHKLVSLDNLAVYWNSKAELISDLSERQIIKNKLKDTIHNGKQKPIGYKYILEPIKMQAKLKLNQKPETDGTDWKTPKIDLAVDMQTLALAIGKLQYQDVLLFLEAQERFQLAGQYLKHRPNLNEYKGHYKDWWRFAYNSILEEKVRRRRNNWSWARMKKHRQLVRDYRDAWVINQTQKSPPAHVIERVKKAEETLDVFNVNVARQQAEMEIDRQGLTRLEDQPQGWIAWGKSWFGNGGNGTQPEKKDKKGGKDIASQFQEAMTPEEKAKLFEAIDYQENIPPTNYPKEFVENKFDFKLNQVAIVVDGAISLQLLQLKAHVEQRPSASAMHVVSSIQELRMDGCGAEMLRVRDPSRAWLSLMLDTRPLSGEYDQKVQLSIAPINLKYHAPAVNNAIEVFKPPESVKLNQLTALAMSRYEEVKARSVTGLAHAVENKSKLVLDICIEPATIMVSEGGIYKPEKPTILADLGLLTVKTVESEGKSHKSKMEELREQAYDKFHVKLSNVVVVLAENFEKAHDALSLKESPLHILKPTGLDIQIHKSSIDDLSLPKMRIVGDLPDIIVGISDRRLIMMMKLLNSIPKPAADEEIIIEEAAPELPQAKLKDRAKMRTIMETNEVDDVIEKTQAPPPTEEEKGKTSEQQVQIELDLRLNQIGLVLFRNDDILCDVSILRMACKLQMRTFDMVVTAELGAVRISMPMFTSFDVNRKFLYLIDNDEQDKVLMKLKFVQANPESPFFATEYHRTEQTVDFQFSRLNMSLHQEGLMELKKFGEDLQAEMAKLETKPQSESERKPEDLEARTRKISRAISHSVESLTAMAKASQSEAAAEKRKARKERAMAEADPTIIKMRVDARIGSLALLMGTQKNGFETRFSIQSVKSDVTMTLKAMDVSASLQAITVEDCTKEAFYKKLMSVAGDQEMLKFEMKQYQRTDAEKNAMLSSDVDMKVKVRLAQMRFVFLNLWVSRLMAWLLPFQEEAQRAAAAAQQVASEKAHEAAQNVKQLMESSPPRIELDVELMAPVIVVPRLSSSADVIVAILGNVSVKNKIMGHKEHAKAVLDKMDIKLTEMTLGIGRVNETASEVVSTCEILKPLTFVINCHRNLTFGTVKQVPEITVNAHIPAIEMNMSEQDYATIMQTLSGNLAEGKPDVEPAVVSTQAAIAEASVTSSDDIIEEEDETEETADRKKSVVPKKSTAMGADRMASAGAATAFNRMIFQFTLDKIVAVLYTGGTAHGEIRKAEDAFAAMRLYDLKLSGLIKEDNALDVSMSLNAFTMEDERRHKTKIHRLMDKKKDHEHDQFLALRFSQNADADKNVALKMSAFFICLCPEFLGCLSRFFAVPPTEEQLEKQATATIKSPSGVTPAVSEAKPVQPAAPAGTLTIDCDMKGVEVILIENSMEPETTQALILFFNVNLDAKPSDKITTMKGGIEKLAVFSSYYAESRRNEVTYEVLKPMNIGVEVTMNAVNKGCEAVLSMSPMEVKMSPSIIRLLSSVNEEFAKSSAVTTETTSTNSSPKQRTYPNYWAKKIIDKKKYWFFNVPTAEEAVEDAESAEEVTESTVIVPPETAKVQIEKISFTLEAGTGEVPTPMIFLDLLVNAEAANWSSALKATADVSIQMSYYNEAFSVWEPVIEPVEVSPEKFERWDLRMNVKGRDKLNPNDTSPAMDVKIEADKILNVTVTKSFLNLLNQLSEVFAQAAKQISPPLSRQLPGESQFVLLNETGISVKVSDSDTIKASGSQGHPIDATHGAYVELNLKKDAGCVNSSITSQNCLEINREELQGTLRLEVLESVRELAIGRAEKRSIPLGKRSEAGKQWKVVAETSIENGRRLVTLTSHIHVENHLDVAMELYAKRDTTLDLFGCLPPGGSMPLPVPLLYTQTGEIYFKPANDKCEVSFESLCWHMFENEPAKRQTIRCDISADLTQGYFFETVLETEDILESADKSGVLHTIHLYPPLQFHNNLPIPITIEQPIASDLLPGDCAQLNIITGSKLKLWVSYMGEMYALDMKIPQEKADVDVVALNTETGSAELLLGLNWSHEHGDQKVYLFAPFWLVNNTSLPLRHAESGGGFISSARGCVSCHKSPPTDEADTTVRHLPDENPLILPFPCIDLSKKKKAKVQIENVSGWSEEIPLDVVGNPSRVVCKANDRDYEVTVDIKLCQSGLTKVVTFTPFYLVSNLSRFDMQVREDKQDNWIDVPAEKCVGVWPVNKAKKKLYSARYKDTETESLLFPITENLETLCEIGGDAAGVNVSVSTGESSVAIHLSSFQPGSAPVCVMNSLKIPITFGQKGHSRVSLAKNEMAYFTWASLVDDRVMELECGDWKHDDRLEANSYHDVHYKKGFHRVVYMTNFLMGRQRTILFTDDLEICRAAYGSWETDSVDMQTEISLQGIGLSIVDNLAGKEILYIGISSSDILWEEEVKKGRFKPLTVKHMELLEEKYQQHLVHPNGEYQPLDHFEVNMKNMLIKKKKGKEFKIRRIFEKGIWMNYGQSAQRKRLHFKLNHLQIDNQLDACVFPRVLAVVPPPKSVVADNAPKPFVELSLLQRVTEYSPVPEIEYAHVLVQEFAVQVDIGLLNSLMSLVASQGKSKPYGKEMFDQDFAMANVQLEDTAKQYKSMRPKSYYADLHISPLMIHLSFSQGGMSDGGEGGIAIQSEFINLFMKSVGVSLTELQDVVFKLAYFERRSVFYSPDQLNGEIVSHYAKQFMKQLYVLVLGLDIIGNPFGLVRDLSAGVEDLFYQPFQGAIQGPEEFAQGVALGVQSMFGHAVGGAAGAVGRITGTVGKGVAALTFDSEYQRKRQEDMNRKPQSFGEGMARGVKGLGMGIMDGVTGVVTKPIEGAKQEGAKGLFKGVGKGLIGVVTRPVSGVVDFASSTMDSVKAVAGTNRDAAALRPPRVIREDKIVRPFSKSEAVGFKIFKDTDRGSLAETDQFVAYAPITDKIALLVTDKQLVLAKRTDVMGTWTADWQTEYSKIHEPQFVTGGVKVLLKEKKRGFLGIGASDGKIITFPNAENIQQKVLAAYRAAVN